MVTYRPIGDDVDPRGEVGVGDVTRQVVHEVDDNGADLRKINQHDVTATDHRSTHKASVEDVLRLQRVVCEFPFPDTEEDENHTTDDEHRDHGGYEARRISRVL